jgi:hypothetical protein
MGEVLLTLTTQDPIEVILHRPQQNSTHFPERAGTSIRNVTDIVYIQRVDQVGDGMGVVEN